MANPKVTKTPEWQIFDGTGQPRNPLPRWPEAPPWRRFQSPTAPDRTPPPEDDESSRRLGKEPVALEPAGDEVLMVNAAIHLRRALLVTGNPGVGKSALAFLIARELKLGSVLRWPITTRVTLQDGLYRYDALARLQTPRTEKRTGVRHPPAAPPTASGRLSFDADGYHDLGRFLRLGPLGTALIPRSRPRVLLIDEIDKSDLDLPNDLLAVLEDGSFPIPELERYERVRNVRVRTADVGGTAIVADGRITCQEFPVIVMTSNREREFPPAFLRRCIRLNIPDPGRERLSALVASQLGDVSDKPTLDRLLDMFHPTEQDQTAKSAMPAESGPRRAPDQLLNAVFLVARNAMPIEQAELLRRQLLKPLEE
jgi:MoxR-like ATPase